MAVVDTRMWVHSSGGRQQHAAHVDGRRLGALLGLAGRRIRLLPAVVITRRLCRLGEAQRKRGRLCRRDANAV